MNKWILAGLGLLFATWGRGSNDGSNNEGTFEDRWKRDVPQPYNQQYSTFFRETDKHLTESIYKWQVITIKRLLRGLESQPYNLKRVQNAYRDPDFNKRIKGDPRSLHMRGMAIDFFLDTDLRDIPESDLESMGKALNRVGLKVIWYPFRKSDRSSHVQISESAARGYRRITYRGRGERGYHNSYKTAKGA
jgi:uncharacterized protein YcbK (DUF882 family)